jgi:co-chaperonin GroES (HSP10)
MIPRPLRDFVVIRPLTDAREGLIEVVKLDGKWRRGRVLAVGPGKRDKHGVHKPWGACVGDVVQFSDVLTYPEFDTGTERVLLIQEADICGVEDFYADRPDPFKNVPDQSPFVNWVDPEWAEAEADRRLAKDAHAATLARFERVA